MTSLKEIFSRYTKERAPEEAHAKLSASGSERWLNCPGSVRLSEGITNQDNPASIRGTHTHTLLQFILENKEWQTLLNTPEGVRFRMKIEYDPAMLRSATFAAKYVWAEKAQTEKRTGRPVQLHVEKKVELLGVGFGTADVILYQPYGRLHVIDYKNGTKAVEAKDNTQGLYYAHAAADLFNWNFCEVAFTILQPNDGRSDHARTWKVSDEDLERAGSLFRRGAHLTTKPDAPLVRNDSWCWFCPARPKCPAHQKGRIDRAMEKFENEDLHAYAQ